MEFFCYHRDRPGSAALRDELLEQHWAYMDQYTKTMIARGPTFADDGDTPTGSVHIVDLPDPAAARAFAFDEPNYQAGAYRDVLLRRWRNTLGRTMWDFPGGRDGGNGYLVRRPGEHDSRSHRRGSAANRVGPETHRHAALVSTSKATDHTTSGTSRTSLSCGRHLLLGLPLKPFL